MNGLSIGVIHERDANENSMNITNTAETGKEYTSMFFQKKRSNFHGIGVIAVLFFVVVKILLK
jgi:hypothetical protein